MSTDEKVTSFQEITGVSDRELCRQMLENAGWDLEQAVHVYLAGAEDIHHSAASTQHRHRHVEDQDEDEEDGMHGRQLRHRMPWARGSPPVSPLTPTAEPTTAPSASTSSSSRTTTTNTNTTLVLPGWIPKWNWLQFFLKLALRAYHGLAGIVSGSLSLMTSFLYHLLPGAAHAGVQGAEFVVAFRRRYGNTHPRFVEGSWEEALRQARTSLKCLCVYIEDPGAPSTDRFSREVLCSADVLSFVEDNVVLWGASLFSRHGASLARLARLRSYPAVVLLASTSNVVLIGSSAGAEILTSEGFIHALSHHMERGATPLEAERRRRHEQRQTQLLREEQDREFQQALQADMERQAKADAARQQEQQQHEKERQEALERQRAEEAALNAREAKRSSLPPPPATGQEAIKVSFRLFDGARLDRAFSPTDTVQTLYDFVEVQHPSVPPTFALFVGHPKRCIHASPRTLRDEVFGAREVVFVEEVEA